MKTISSALRTHLDETVTTLSTIWKITRTDETEFFFTDHDVDISFDGDTYTATTGYNRTAVANNTGLSVDNLDVEGVFDSDQITETDLRAGLFDYAEIRISIINWSDPSQGVLKQRRGRLGEVVLTQQGVFRSELRGLAQQLSQNMCELYQAECRADLGDSKCGVQIKPPILTRSALLPLGDTYRVASNVAGSINWENLINNDSFEIDAEELDIAAITDWVIVGGAVSIVGDYLGLTAYLGTQYLCGGASSSFEIRQDIELIETFGISLTEIDTGNVEADFTCHRANNDVDDTGRVLVQFLDIDTNPISTMYDTGNEVISPLDTWAARAISSVAVPTGARFVRVRFLGTKVSGTRINSCLDAVDLTLTETASTNTYDDIYENRMYEVTTEGTSNPVQPSYDTIIGNSTTEPDVAATGTVELTAGASGSVDSVTVDSIESMSGVVAFDTDLNTTATNVAANITAHTSAPNYTATATGAMITIVADDAGVEANSLVVVSTATTITTEDTDMGGGVDGAVLICRDAWMRYGHVTGVVDRRILTIDVVDARASDDWFNYGALVFESGLNTGVVSEIKDWDATTKIITLYISVPFNIYPGCKVRLYPGCDKRLSTCKNRFSNVLNYRGEPFVPGQDELISYASASSYS